MTEKKYSNKNRNKDINLSGLYAVSYDYAYKNGKPLQGTCGVVSKNTPYICLVNSSESTKPGVFWHDMTGKDVPKVLKNRILAFYGDKDNTKKSTCYLVEKPLYEEMVGHKVGKSTEKPTNQSSFSGKKTVRKPATTSYGKGASKTSNHKADF